MYGGVYRSSGAKLDPASAFSINITLLRSAIDEPRLLNRGAIFHLYNLRFSRAVHRHDEEIVVLRLRNDRVLRTAQRFNNLRHGVVVTSDENSLPRMLRAN